LIDNIREKKKVNRVTILPDSETNVTVDLINRVY